MRRNMDSGSGKNGKRNGKISHGILRSILLLAAGLVLGVNLYLWNAQGLVGNALPMPFGYGAAVVLSGSMEPALSVNDLVIVHQEDSYEEGDIVVYQSGKELIIHRLIMAGEDGKTVLTKGDANLAADAPVQTEDIKGRMTVHIPGIGAVVRALKTPAGTFLVLAAAFFLLEFSYRREKDQGEEEIERIKEEIRRLSSGQDEDT